MRPMQVHILSRTQRYLFLGTYATLHPKFYGWAQCCPKRLEGGQHWLGTFRSQEQSAVRRSEPYRKADGQDHAAAGSGLGFAPREEDGQEGVPNVDFRHTLICNIATLRAVFAEGHTLWHLLPRLLRRARTLTPFSRDRCAEPTCVTL